MLSDKLLANTPLVYLQHVPLVKSSRLRPQALDIKPTSRNSGLNTVSLISARSGTPLQAL